MFCCLRTHARDPLRWVAAMLAVVPLRKGTHPDEPRVEWYDYGTTGERGIGRIARSGIRGIGVAGWWHTGRVSPSRRANDQAATQGSAATDFGVDRRWFFGASYRRPHRSQLRSCPLNGSPADKAS